MSGSLAKTSVILANNSFQAYSSSGLLRYPAPIEEYDMFYAGQPMTANSSVEFLVSAHNIRPINCIAIFGVGENLNSGSLTFELYDELGTTIFWQLVSNYSSAVFGNASIITFPTMVIEKNRRVKLTTTRALQGLICYCQPVGELEKYPAL